MAELLLVLALAFPGLNAAAEGLGPEALGVIYNRDDPASTHIAEYYRARRHIPMQNLIGLAVPDRARISRGELDVLRTEMLKQLPTSVQALLLVWSRPYAVECMSVTSAFAAGYRPDFCEPGCSPTRPSPLFDSDGWLPADTVGWLPAMLLPSADETLARRVIELGIAADGSHPTGTAYLVRTQDSSRGVRAAGYLDAGVVAADRLKVSEISTPILQPLSGIMAYFTGAIRVVELPKLTFRPGAVADHLTSTGGILDSDRQMSALEWLKQGATASYGSVSEPCNFPGKFPRPATFLDHSLHGDTLLEAYWKSVEMPGQGLFIGEPLARAYPRPSAY
ncbi:MAG: TIGR03790 family protein [Steroidobacteraceae bacterium]